MASPDHFEPYDRLREVEPDLYCIDGDWQGTRFRRRMTIMRTRAKQLVIHSPIRLQEADYAKIETLGLVSHIVAPNRFHQSDAAEWRRRFPLATFHPPGTAGHWPMGLRKEIDCLPFDGTRLLQESVYFHVVSRTLVVTDLVFNLQMEVEGFEKFLFKLNGVYKHFGPSRLLRYGFINDVDQARRSLRRILEWDFERVIMSHGTILEREGRVKLAFAFAERGIIAN